MAYESKFHSEPKAAKPEPMTAQQWYDKTLADAKVKEGGGPGVQAGAFVQWLIDHKAMILMLLELFLKGQPPVVPPVV
jgi:hypothetical protein